MADDSQNLQNPLDLSQYITAQSEQANKSLGRGNDQYDWAKAQFAKNADTAGAVQSRALDTGAHFANYAKRDRDLYDAAYVPAMQQQLDYAQQYTTPERMAANRAQAITSGSLAANAVRAASERNLQSIGIDPSSGRYAGLEAGIAAKQAALNAGLATKSDRDTEMMGQQLLANAIKTGQVLPGQAVNQAGVSLAADKEAIDTGLATTASGAQTMGTPLQWANLGSDTLKEWKSGMIAQTNAGMENQRLAMEREKLAAGSSSGMGALLGGGAGLLGKFGGQAMSMFGGMGGGAGGAGGAGGVATDAGSWGGGVGDMFSGTGMTYRRGGVVPQKPIKKFFSGGFSGFSAPDVRPISMGEGQQAFDPYDPGASLWGQFGEVDNPEFEDTEAEGIGRGVGGTVGGTIGQIWGPIGQMAGREIGQKVGAGVGAVTQGDWGGAAESLVEGTPFDFIFEKGGAVRDDDDDEDEGPLTEEEMEELEELRAMERGKQNDGSVHEYAGGGQVRRHQRGGMVLDEQGNPIREPEFDPEGEGYDYDQARAAGMGPDEEGHWQSREPGSGMMLKGRKHPTFDKGVEEDRRKGYGLEKQNGRYYTQPFARHAQGGTVGLRDTWGANAYADGGDVEDPTMVDAEELAAAGNGGGDVPNMVPPEASPSGGQETDDVHAMLNEGEFVIPKQVVSWHGEKFFQNLIKKAYNEMQQPQVAEPETGPPQAMAISPPTFASQGG